MSGWYKRAVHVGEHASDKLGPYLLLYTKGEEYLRRQTDDKRLDLALRCLDFKEGRMAKQIEVASDWGCEVMDRPVSDWNWSTVTVTCLDCRAEWNVNETLEERKIVVHALACSYKRLSQFACEHALTESVSKRDMTILGRKLFTAFEHKAGKVALVNHGISKDLSETHLYLEHIESAEGQRLLAALPSRTWSS
jgi:adenylate cyclase class 1